MKIKIGTRASALAVWQAEHVKALLQKHHNADVELVKISTKGDQILDRSLQKIGGKGLFLKEIQEALIAGEVDIAVHSMKDVPWEEHDQLQIVSVLERANPYDAFVCNTVERIEDLPKGAVVGTGSLRRSMQLKLKYPHLQFKGLRGNVNTRLKKLDEGEYDAIILACAGLERLDFHNRIASTVEIVPAVGQGVIGVECRSSDSKLKEALSCLHHEKTAQEIKYERLFSKLVQGSCQTPMGCHVQISDDEAQVDVFFAREEGAQIHNDSQRLSVSELENWLKTFVSKF